MARELTRLAEGIQGAEGPVFDRDGRLFMVCPPRGQVLEILADGEPRVVIEYDGIPAGLQVDRTNHIWIADMKRGICRTTRQGARTDVVSTFEDQPIRGCNDCYFDSKGNLYFSAPAGSGRDQPVGEVYCRLTDGTVLRLDDGYRFSNGLAVSADDATLIVAETFACALWAYTIESPGKVGEKRLFAKLPDDPGPDGMDFDDAGNLLVAHWGASTIDVFDRNGQLIERVAMPAANVTNVHFGGRNRTTVFTTMGTPGEVWHFEWDRPGQAQYCEG